VWFRGYPMVKAAPHRTTEWAEDGTGPLGLGTESIGMPHASGHTS